MLLFVKGRFADAIFSGRKTIEIRAGKRYAGIRAGDFVSINGRFRRMVHRVDHAPDVNHLISKLTGRFASAGFVDE